MKLLMLSVLAALLMLPASGYAQRLGSDITDRTERVDTGATHPPEHPSSDFRHREQHVMPESHIPPRSPDLGSPTSPLSPSIGPGSGLLGPEGGRAPTRLRSDAEAERGGTGSGSRSR